MSRIEPTLIVNNSDSRCANCGEGADPDEKTHKTVMGWGKPYDHDGCGIK